MQPSVCTYTRDLLISESCAFLAIIFANYLTRYLGLCQVIPLPELEMYRSTVTTAMKIATNKRVMTKYKDEALKAATKLYRDDQQKENGMSAKEVERRIKKHYSGPGTGKSREILRQPREAA